jgi:hypothetical protein
MARRMPVGRYKLDRIEANRPNTSEQFVSRSNLGVDMSTSSVLERQFRQSNSYRVATGNNPEVAVEAAESPIGMLNFVDGTPTEDTIRRLHDNLDRTHGLDVFLKNYSGVSLYRLWKAQRRRNLERDQIRLYHGAFPSQLQLPRTSRFEGWCSIDLEKEGATIIDLPPDLLGVVVDMWFRLVGDLGPAALDGRRGGKYLILPPRQQLEIPDGYGCRILRSKTNRVWLFLRTLRVRCDTDFNRIANELGIRSLAVEQGLKRIEMADASKLALKGNALNDHGFFEDLDRLVQTEAFGALDRESYNLLASIGIAKGKPFRPSLRMKRIFRDAAIIGRATVRAMAQKKPHGGSLFRNPSATAGPMLPRRTERALASYHQGSRKGA